MVTPFDGGRSFYINMLETEAGNFVITASGVVGNSLAAGTTNTDITITLPWAVFTQNVYWCISWSHQNASSATGGMKLNLVDHTNGSVLYTFSSNATTGQGLSTALATAVVFTKPTTVARIAIQVQNGDTTARNFSIFECGILTA